MTTISAEKLARLFVAVADTLVDEFDLIDFMHLVTSRTASLLDDSPVGLLLSDQHGTLQFVAASDENVRLLELFQLQQATGPCLDAFRTGKAVINADLTDAAERWPAFAPRAVEAGFRSVHAFPLRLRQETIGVLNVFSDAVGGRLSPTDIEVVQALADIAAIGLLQERAISRSELLAEQLQVALNTRVVIEQAKGALAHSRQITVEDAFTLMRTYARRNGLRLGDVAHRVLENVDDLPGLGSAE